MKKLLALFSLALALVFVLFTIALRPLWYDINDFLGTTLPLMPALLGLGALLSLYCLSLACAGALAGRRARLHLGLMLAGDALMLALLVIMFSQIGVETALLWEELRQMLPWVLGLGALALLFWLAPAPYGSASRVVKWLRDWRARLLALAGLGLLALLWWSLPWQTVITAQPLVFIRGGSLNAVWQTNLRASATVRYGTGELTQSVTSQAFGLKTLNPLIQSAALPLPPAGGSLKLQAVSEGVKDLFPISAVKTGSAKSQVVSVTFPPAGSEITFVSFSDLHEQTDLYRRLAANVDWQSVSLAVFNGDMVNSVLSPQQVGRTLFNLPTGGLTIPRVYVRGNHETRGEDARQLDDWLLPAGGRWYHAFTLGDTFFIALDCGEADADDYIEYSGLVDFTTYHQEQARWLEGVFASAEYKAARYRIVLLHTPLNKKVSPAFAPVQRLVNARQDVDLMVSGHSHVRGIWLPAETGLPYAIATSGGYLEKDAAFVRVRTGAEGLLVQVVDINGKAVKTAEMKR